MHSVVPKKGILDIPFYNPASQGNPGTAIVARLCSNEAALGPSPKAVLAYQNAATDLHRYPDGSNSKLRSALAEYHQIDFQGIICSSGSEDLLRLIAFAYAGPGDEIIYSQYGFIVYHFATLAVGAKPIKVPEKNFAIDVDGIISAVSERTKIVFLANPNNPTGTYVPFSEIQRLIKSIPSNVLVVLDEAYADYISEQSDYTFPKELVGRGNLIITRTFSKMYALASARLGWAYSTPEIVMTLNRIQSAFPISTATQEAGIAALHDIEHIEKCKKHNSYWLNWLSSSLVELGLIVTPSVGNFLLTHFPSSEEHASFIYSKLQSHGIRTRPMNPYGLPQCLRISVGNQKENECLIQILTDIISHKVSLPS